MIIQSWPTSGLYLPYFETRYTSANPVEIVCAAPHWCAEAMLLPVIRALLLSALNCVLTLSLKSRGVEVVDLGIEFAALLDQLGVEFGGLRNGSGGNGGGPLGGGGSREMADDAESCPGAFDNQSYGICCHP